jgi:hypothetical protein
MPKGKTSILSAITDGCPDARVSAQLIDTDVLEKKPETALLTAEADKLEEIGTNSSVTVTVTATPPP